MGSDRPRLALSWSWEGGSLTSSLLEEESDTCDNLRIVSVTWLTVRTGRRPHTSLLPLEEALASEMWEAVRVKPPEFGGAVATATLMLVRLRPRRTTSILCGMSEELLRRLALAGRSPYSIPAPPAPPSASMRKALLAALEMKL